MDDLKSYGKNDKELDGILYTVKKFSDDIGMEFGLDKYSKTKFIREDLHQRARSDWMKILALGK